MLSTSVEELEAGIISKQKELENERALLRQDEETRHQLSLVQDGLEARGETLRLRRAEKQDSKSAMKKLKRESAALERDMKTLMTSLMQFCDTLFEEDKDVLDQRSRRGYQLRHLIDVSRSVRGPCFVVRTSENASSCLTGTCEQSV
jgi:hypothetical protein